MTASGREARKYPRVKTDVNAQVKPSGRVMFEAQIQVLGEGGLFLATNERLMVGRELVVTAWLDLQGKERSCLFTGKVVWVNYDAFKGAIGAGVCFDQRSPAMARILKEFVTIKLTEVAEDG